MSSRAMLSRLVAARALASARPRVPVLRRNSTTVAAPSAPTPTASTEKLPPDDRPFVIRYKWAILLTTAFGSWIYTLVMQNRTSRLRDSTEDEVQARSPVNPDEMLELRAVNDISTAQLATLPAIMARNGTSVIASPQQLLGGLREAVGEVQDGYVVERMLMAHPTAATGGGGAVLDAPLAVAALTFLSSGPVAERLAAMHAMLAEPDSGGVRTGRLTALLDALKETGQVPVEQRVCTVDEGKNQLGVPLNYLRPQPVREYVASEWVAQWLQGSLAAGDSSEPSTEPPAAPAVPRDADLEVELDLAAFVELLTSEMVCVWGECHNIRERKRLQKQHVEAEEYASNPPAWQFWKWGSKPSG